MGFKSGVEKDFDEDLEFRGWVESKDVSSIFFF